MVSDIFELKTQIKIKVYKKNGLNSIRSDWWKSAFKMASEDPEENITKNYEKHEIVWLF